MFTVKRGASDATRSRSVVSTSEYSGRRSKTLSRMALTGLLILGAAGFAVAQNSNSGDLRGTVTDATGGVIPDVKVTIQNINTGVVRELTTNAAGLYDTASILPGKYRITFSKEGFDKLVRDGIDLEASILTVDAQLRIGTAQQQVEVTAEATLLKTETA